MGYKTKVQMVNRKYSKQFYVVIPVPMAEALEIQKGEAVEWKIEDKKKLILRRGVKYV